MNSHPRILVPALTEHEPQRLVDVLLQLVDALQATLPDDDPDPDPGAFYRYCDQLEAARPAKR